MSLRKPPHLRLIGKDEPAPPTAEELTPGSREWALARVREITAAMLDEVRELELEPAGDHEAEQRLELLRREQVAMLAHQAYRVACNALLDGRDIVGEHRAERAGAGK